MMCWQWMMDFQFDLGLYLQPNVIWKMFDLKISPDMKKNVNFRRQNGENSVSGYHQPVWTVWILSLLLWLVSQLQQPVVCMWLHNKYSSPVVTVTSMGHQNHNNFRPSNIMCHINNWAATLAECKSTLNCGVWGSTPSGKFYPLSV